MRHTASITAFIISTTLLLLISASAHAADFSIKALNRTKGKPLSDYPVSVQVLNKDQRGRYSTVRSIEARTNSSGVATGQVDTSGGAFVGLEVIYRGVKYRSGVLPADASSFPFDVSVFEITDKYDNVRLTSRRMIVLAKNARTLEVYETIEVQNTGDRVFVGKFNDELDATQVLFIPMPYGYSLNSFSGYQSPKVRNFGRGIITQNEIHPGTHEINLYYFVMSDIGKFDMTLFTEKDAPEIDMLTLFFPNDDSWSLKQSSLKKTGTQMVNDKPYEIYKGTPSSAVKLLVFGPSYGGGLGIWHVSIALALILAVGFLYFAKDYMAELQLSAEEKRITALMDDYKDYAQEAQNKGLYRPMAEALQKRLDELKSQSD